jgi:hypothetical protein
LARDETIQMRHADDKGFCPFHTWQLESIASPQGLSSGYPRLMERLAREVLGLAATVGSASHGVRSLIQSPKGCRVCQEIRETENRYVQRLADLLITGEGREAYAQSQGVCLKHLALLLDAVASADGRAFLLAEAARRFDEIAEDLQSYALKHEGLRRQLENQDEEDAYLRALVRVAGSRHLSFFWEER